VRGTIAWIQEQLARDNGGVSSRGYRARLQSGLRRHMGRTFLWLATVKILGDADSRRPCAREHRVVNGDHLPGMMVWIQEDTERDYSQTEYGKNVWWLANGSDGEILWRCFSWRRCVREDRMDWREGRKEQLAMDDGCVDSRGYRARLQSERIWEERSGYGDDGENPQRC
jgi:hypothetical protein